MTFDELGAATVRIEAGASRGSGFHFLEPGIIVTCDHVVSHGRDAVLAVAEDSMAWDLELLSYSDESQHDFAIYRATSAITGREVLHPSRSRGDLPARGTGTLFAGFPHGVPDLLVQGGRVAGHESDETFYVDASVNGGCSGGPVVDEQTGVALGVVTSTRFLGAADLYAMAEAAQELEDHCSAIAGRGSVAIMGVNFGEFAAMVAASNQLLRRALENNANTGIGIALDIGIVVDECHELGLV